MSFHLQYMYLYKNSKREESWLKKYIYTVLEIHIFLYYIQQENNGGIKYGFDHSIQ